jgi:alkylation response protein AidB-like acyl-CoA dehydrogenase
MDMMPTQEQEEIAAAAASLLAKRLPVVGLGLAARPASGGEIDPMMWRECAELGWLSLGLPEAVGGVGYGLVEEMMLFRELGRGVVGGPFLPGVLAAHLAAATGDVDLVARISSGETLVALGTPVGASSIGPVVTGEFSLMHVAGATLALACDDQGAALFPISSGDVSPIDAVESSLSAGRCRMAGVPAVASATAATVPIFLRALVLAAAVSTGVGEAALAVSVAYANQRVQFGRPIGINQAIKHWCADMAVRSDGAYAQASFAAVAVRDGLPGAAVEAAIAKYFADEAARLNSEGAVQIHGAIGFTSEATPYRFVYRSHAIARCLASRTQLLDRVVGRS